LLGANFAPPEKCSASYVKHIKFTVDQNLGGYFYTNIFVLFTPKLLLFYTNCFKTKFLVFYTNVFAIFYTKFLLFLHQIVKFRKRFFGKKVKKWCKKSKKLV